MPRSRVRDRATDIEVTALSDGGHDRGPGLHFAAINGELTVAGNGMLSYIDLTFGFSVASLAPAQRIKDRSLS